MNSQPWCVCFANDMQIPSMESTFLQERGTFPVSFGVRLCRCRHAAFRLKETGDGIWRAAVVFAARGCVCIHPF